MAAKLVADLERPLEIDVSTLLPAGNRRQAQRLFPGLDFVPALVAAIIRQPRHRQAHAAMGDGRTHIDGLGIVIRRHPQTNAFSQGFQLGNGSDVGDNSGKHQIGLS
ncbi:hypothetical protein D3C77_712420 [compost metagenome]